MTVKTASSRQTERSNNGMSRVIFRGFAITMALALSTTSPWTQSLWAQSGSLLSGAVGPGSSAPQQPTPSGAANGRLPSSGYSAARPPAMQNQRLAQRPTGTMGIPQNYPAQTAYPTSGEQPLTISQTSWTYEAPTSARTYRLNDIVTIRVDEISRMAAEGNSESRRNSLYDAILQDWVRLDSWNRLNPAAQKEGDPRIQMANNQLSRADASLESRQSFTFNIAARVVDIRPNGDLVLEARKTILYNENAWETSLSGICRPVDIAPDNTVLSRDLLDLQMRSQERGELRDGYKRGWFAKLVSRILPY